MLFCMQKAAAVCIGFKSRAGSNLKEAELDSFLLLLLCWSDLNCPLKSVPLWVPKQPWPVEAQTPPDPWRCAVESDHATCPNALWSSSDPYMPIVGTFSSGQGPPWTPWPTRSHPNVEHTDDCDKLSACYTFGDMPVTYSVISLTAGFPTL